VRVHAIARKSPQSVKWIVKAAWGMIPSRLRLGRAFWETYRFLEQSQEWDAAGLEEYQMRELRRLLAQCYRNVPHYRKVFEERGLKPSHIQSLADLKQLPLLCRQQIRKDPQAFLARNRKVHRLRQQVTTCTLGQPFQFYLDRHQLQRDWAFACHLWSRVGYRPGDTRAELWGLPIEGPRPYWWDPLHGILRLCPILGDEETVRLYLDMIRSYRIRFLYGYPSAVMCLATMIRRYGLEPNLDLRAILFSSETVYPWQRAIAEGVFACRTCSLYGMAEQIVLAGDCEGGRDYHFVPQYGITEIDPQTGEIIGTGFLNHAQPFLRYRTWDVATLPARCGCERCGRQYYPIVSEIEEGRVQDFVITPEGIPLSSCTLMLPFNPSRTIACVQIVQESVDRVVLRTAPVDKTNPGPYSEELAAARRGLQQMLGKDVTIRQESISPEEYAGSGELRFVVSHLPQETRGDRGNTAL
jgi:phenylacetate-CoA ligase